MGKLEDCVSKLSIIATSNISDGTPEQARTAINHYLRRSKGCGVERLKALRQLIAVYDELRLDSSASDEIRSIIAIAIRRREGRSASLETAS